MLKARLIKHKAVINSLLLWLSVAILIYLRVTTFLYPNSLMIDEANVALNLAERDFSGFWQPLDYQQYAPPLFLMCAKLSAMCWGWNEWALRLPAMLASLGSIYLMVRIAKFPSMRLSTPFLILALFIFSASHIMVFQSDLLKQYSSDALCAILLVACALRYNYTVILRRKGFILWTLLGSLLIWFSMPVVFVLASVVLYYVYEGYRAGCGSQLLKAWILPVLIWGIQFTIYFFTILKSEAESSYLQSYHDAYFFEYALWEADAWARNTQIIMGLVQAFVGKTVVVFIWIAGVTVAGIHTLARKQKSLFFLLMLPLFFAVLASALHYYSFIPRLLVFYMPLFSILLAIGAQALFQLRNFWLRFLVGVSSVVIIVQMSGWKYLRPDTHCLMEETREVMDELRTISDSAQTVFVNHHGAPAVKFYIKYYSHKDKYSFFSDFRSISWNENMVGEAELYLKAHPKSDLLIIWGHERTPVLQNQLRVIKESTINLRYTVEKTMAQGVLLSHAEDR